MNWFVGRYAEALYLWCMNLASQLDVERKDVLHDFLCWILCFAIELMLLTEHGHRIMHEHFVIEEL